MGTATMHAALWGPRARVWAEVQEGQVVPLYEAVLDELHTVSGKALLDIGCGAGMFCKLAARRGAKVSGIDATPEFIAIARERIPGADFRVGEMEELPYENDAFDVVTGFNAFQYAASPVNALREAARILRKEARIVTAVWGRREDTEATRYIEVLNAMLPPPSPGAPGAFALSEEGALDALVVRSGLRPEKRGEANCIWEYPDQATALRALLSGGTGMRATLAAGEERVNAAVAEAIAPFRTPSGGYRLNNKFIYLVAAA